MEITTMNAHERHERIIQAVAQNKTISVRRAMDLTGASEITIRRDFTRLAENGSVERFHGGIGLPAGEKMSSFAFRQIRFSEEKAAIAKVAASLLQPGDTIFVDGGTTTCHLAACIPDIPLSIFTNSLRFVEAMESRRGLSSRQEIHLTGGLLYPKSGLLIGPGVMQGLQQYYAKWAFISVGGVTDQGLYNTSERVVEAERSMIQHADQVVVLADHSKIGNYAMCSICGLDQVDTLITDADPKRSTLLPRLEKAGITVLHAETV